MEEAETQALEKWGKEFLGSLNLALGLGRFAVHEGGYQWK